MLQNYWVKIKDELGRLINTKQLLVAWITVVLICMVIFFAPKDYLMYSGGGRIKRIEPTDQFAYRAIVKIKWDKVVQRSLILLLLGAMAIYTLKDADKKKRKTKRTTAKKKTATRKTKRKKT